MTRKEEWLVQSSASIQDWVLFQMDKSCALGCHDQKSSFQKIDFHPSLPAFPQLTYSEYRQTNHELNQTMTLNRGKNYKRQYEWDALRMWS